MQVHGRAVGRDSDLAAPPRPARPSAHDCARHDGGLVDAAGGRGTGQRTGSRFGECGGESTRGIRASRGTGGRGISRGARRAVSDDCANAADPCHVRTQRRTDPAFSGSGTRSAERSQRTRVPRREGCCDHEHRRRPYPGDGARIGWRMAARLQHRPRTPCRNAPSLSRRAADRLDRSSRSSGSAKIAWRAGRSYAGRRSRWISARIPRRAHTK